MSAAFSMKDIQKDLFDALKAGGLDDFFSNCTDSHRREYKKWIEEAKRPETRKLRISLAVKMISAKLAGEAARSKKKA
jgi:uncharacterized protein YdeI (YjbR/CyaY-like superfamily)